jgi:hypothetical protein
MTRVDIAQIVALLIVGAVIGFYFADPMGWSFR